MSCYYNKIVPISTKVELMHSIHLAVGLQSPSAAIRMGWKSSKAPWKVPGWEGSVSNLPTEPVSSPLPGVCNRCLISESINGVLVRRWAGLSKSHGM